MAGFVLLTQPGWAFATEAELRSRGFGSSVTRLHRDSTLLLHGGQARAAKQLRTPAEVCGTLASEQRTGGADATRLLQRALEPGALKTAVLTWLPHAPRSGVRRYSISCETWGKTALQRNQLEEAVRRGLTAAFPRWKEVASGGLRVICKADPDAAALGLQLASNLEQAPGRPGALRRHLAASLLALAGGRDGDTVFDPFMGSGGILREAVESLRAVHCIGADEDAEALQAARPALPGATLLDTAFEDLDVERLPAEVRLVSNLPFGVRFQQAGDAALVQFLRAVLPRCRGVALLMGREQARRIARKLGLETRNVLVLGQPGAIVYRHGR